MRRLARMLAVFTALSTMLVGLTLLSVAMLREPWPTPSIGSAADDPDTAAESGGERIEDEREEEPDSKTHLFAGRSSGELPTGEHRSATVARTLRLPPERRPCVTPIRGPPPA